MSVRLPRLILTFVATMAIFAGLVSPASAHPMEGVSYTRWQHHAHAVGYPCGEIQGNWAKIGEVFAWSNNHLAQADVNTTWTSNSDTAIRAWQRAHNMASVDGCVGFNTWDRAGASDHMTYQGTVSGYWSRFRYKEPNQTRLVTMDAGLYWWFQWFDGWKPFDHGNGTCVAIYNYEYSPPVYEGQECH